MSYGLPGAPEQQEDAGQKTRILCPVCASNGEKNHLYLSHGEYFCPLCGDGDFYLTKDEILDHMQSELLILGGRK